jgi:preprotein translocase subunit SecF
MPLLRLVPDNTRFRFAKWRVVTFPLSAAFTVLTIVLFVVLGFNFGIDFRGGTMLELQAKSGTADLAALRHLGRTFEVGDVEVQSYGNPGGVVIRFALLPGGEAAQSALVARARAALENDYEIRRVETVGPRVSEELVWGGVIGLMLSVLAVLVYLWLRFEIQLALAAILGTLHDIVMIVAFFVITRDEFNMTSIAALLTMVGYSLNETVVVFDRTRELLRKHKSMPIEELIDLSVNSTLARTAMTSTTAFLSILALVLFGGEAIRSFAVVMLYGVVVSTYSAIYISSPALMYIGVPQGARAEPKPGAAAKAKT